MTMAFQAKRATKTYRQINWARADKVFPLLCPVREKDWIHAWAYTMIYSKSELIEEGCIFMTPHSSGKDAIWYVTQYDLKAYFVEFVQVITGEMVIKIQIRLEERDVESTFSHISYEYTGLNPEKNLWIEQELDQEFLRKMQAWEKMINHYLKTGEKLII